MAKKESILDFSGKLFFVIFFVLCFFVLFRFFPIPINADDFGYQWVFKQLSNFSSETIKFLFEANVLARPLALIFYLPLVALFGSSSTLLLLSMHLLSVVFMLALLFFNFKLFSLHFSKRVGYLSSFFLATSYLTTYLIGYVGSMNIAISACFLLAIIYFISLKESKKNLLAVFVLSLLAIFTRETIAFSIALVFVVLAMNELLKTKKFNAGFFWSFGKKFFFLFLPLIIFWFYLKIVFGGIGPFQSALIQHDYLSAFVSFFTVQGVGIYYYFSYFSSYFLLPVFVIAILFSVPNFFSFAKGLLKKRFVFSRKSVSLFFQKHLFSFFLLAAFFGGVIPLVFGSHQAFRYMFPVLPLIFGFVSKLFDDALLSKLDLKQEKVFAFLLLAILAFWIIFFNSNFLVLLFGLNGLTLFLNFLFFLLAIVSIVPLFFVLKNFPRFSGFLRAGFFSLFLLLLCFCVVIQLNEIYSGFFVVQFGNSNIAFHANEFIAKTLPQNARVFSQQNLSWIWVGSFGAFGRGDLQYYQRLPEFSELRQGDFLVYDSIDAGTGILDFVEANSSYFKQIVVFGNGQSVFPRSNLGIYLVLQKQLLFDFFFPRNSEIRVFAFTG